jgi:hypothetical protein
MIFEAVPLPLYSDPSYLYSTDLQGTSFDLTFNYNVRMQSWYLDIRQTGAENYLLQGIKITPEHEIAEGYLLEGLTGYFLLVPIGNSIEKYKTEPQNLSTWFNFFYVYETEE